MTEQAIVLSGRLVGIMTAPSKRPDYGPGPAVILLNSGIIHRVGPGRICVKIARELAAAGFTTLRFDFSGMGDSLVRHDALPFEKSAVEEVQHAMNFLQVKAGSDWFILVGGCSGAYLSLETACHDPRVTGAILINFPITLDGDDSPELADRTAFDYYCNVAPFNFQSWRKFLTGRTNYLKVLRAIRFCLIRRLRQPQTTNPNATRLLMNLQHLIDRRVRVDFVCSERDPRLNDLRAAGGNDLKQWCSHGAVRLEVIPRSDHNFTSLRDHEQLVRLIRERVSAIAFTRVPSGAHEDACFPAFKASTADI